VVAIFLITLTMKYYHPTRGRGFSIWQYTKGVQGRGRTRDNLTQQIWSRREFRITIKMSPK